MISHGKNTCIFAQYGCGLDSVCLSVFYAFKQCLQTAVWLSDEITSVAIEI